MGQVMLNVVTPLREVNVDRRDPYVKRSVGDTNKPPPVNTPLNSRASWRQGRLRSEENGNRSPMPEVTIKKITNKKRKLPQFDIISRDSR